MRTVTVEQRRRALVSRHRLAGDARGPEDATRAMVALHASDPASVYLSVLARSSTSTLADVAHALYERRCLLRWLAMRRTLFVFARDDIPMVHAAVGGSLAATLRTQLTNRLVRNGTEPPIAEDVASWIDLVADATVSALRRRGTATGAQLSADEPRLRTTILARAPSDRPQNLTTSLLTQLGAEARIVRGTPVGAWTSRQHRWETIERWWPDGLPRLDEHRARQDLAHRWLSRFGPATVEDLRWWTGWNDTAARRVLTGLQIEEVDLHGRPGVALADRPDAPERDEHEDEDEASRPPVAALLPALDPTPMGWRHRDWFFDIDKREVFDSAGNIGPTVWWDGRIIGSWAVTSAGQVPTMLRADHGTQAAQAVRQAAEHLQDRLDGAAVTPAVRTPLERAITRGMQS